MTGPTVPEPAGTPPSGPRISPTPADKPKPKRTQPTDGFLDDIPHFESCGCLIVASKSGLPTSAPEKQADKGAGEEEESVPSQTLLPLHSRVPTPDDPVIQGQCIYHDRTKARDDETAIFVNMAPEMDELREVLGTGMVKFRPGGGSGGGAAAVVPYETRPATDADLTEAKDALKILIEERDRLVRELWAAFVRRWGGLVRRKDDGTMFVVDEGKIAEGGGEDSSKGEKIEEDVKNSEDDPYVRRMREVQNKLGGFKT